MTRIIRGYEDAAATKTLLLYYDVGAGRVSTVLGEGTRMIDGRGKGLY